MIKQKLFLNNLWFFLLITSCSSPFEGITYKEAILKKGYFFDHSYQLKKEKDFLILQRKNAPPILKLSLRNAFIASGLGEQSSSHNMGSFKIKEKNIKSCSSQSLENLKIISPKSFSLEGNLKGKNCHSPYKMTFEIMNKKEVSFKIDIKNPSLNRTYFRFKHHQELFYGLGEQFTHLKLNGQKAYILTEEQGIGRGDFPITWGAELLEKSGGNDFSTYAPIPFLITNSPRGIFFENKSYGIIDLSSDDEVKVEFRERNIEGTLWEGKSMLDVIEKYTAKTGRFPLLPDFAYGTWLGMQGGKDKVLKEIQRAKKAGNPVTALWIQDWVGKRKTYFGSRLWWNWQVDEKTYPDFKNFCTKLWNEGTAVLGYVNPYLADKGPLYEHAKKMGYFVKDKKGKDYKIRTPGFPAYIVDLTNKKAYKWLKEIIKTNMIDMGLKGWMADFGEWLPMDSVLHSGISAEIYHNEYPVVWAKLNREAIKEKGLEGQIVFFTRSGFSYSNKYSTLFWEGDQMVSFDDYDGLPSTVIGLLSSGLSGISLNHSDVGGYTTINNPIKNYHRSEELFLRWAELNAFTPIFRTHEGNRPEKNHQPYSSPETIKNFARLGKIHYALKDYLKFFVNEAHTRGFPLVRPLFLHYPNDKKTYSLKKQFLLGTDILVIPVLKGKQKTVKGYLPSGQWRHLLTGQLYEGKKETTFKAPLGTPAVFIKEESSWKEDLLTKLKGL